MRSPSSHSGPSAGGERLAEQPDVRGVDVVAADPVVRVVEEAARVLAEHRGGAGDERVEPGRVVEEAEPLAAELAPGEHRGVVAGEEVGVEQLEPVRAVGRERRPAPVAASVQPASSGLPAKAPWRASVSAMR